MKYSRISLIVLVAGTMSYITRAGASDQEVPAVCPLHAQHMKEAAQGSPDAHARMLERGGAAMGFDQRATSHHFRLGRTGGSIEVHVNDPQDTAMVSAITKHLAGIAQAFSRADFAIPQVVHGEKPAGVDALTRLASAITYTFEPGPLGGRVKIVAASAPALAAVHEFLRYQIREHRTGDPLTIDE
jgi:hypothetical protein